jgi:hypothetical protein
MSIARIGKKDSIETKLKKSKNISIWWKNRKDNNYVATN